MKLPFPYVQDHIEQTFHAVGLLAYPRHDEVVAVLRGNVDEQLFQGRMNEGEGSAQLMVDVDEQAYLFFVYLFLFLFHGHFQAVFALAEERENKKRRMPDTPKTKVR